MRPLSETTAKVASKSFQRKHVALGRVIKNWDSIMGDGFAHKAQPVKINYRKFKKNKKATATLDIAVSSADATLIHYQKDLILQRINQIFGEDWITDIRFVGAPQTKSLLKVPKKIKTPPAKLSPEQTLSLDTLLNEVDDEPIKVILQRLGKGILSQPEQTK